MSDQVFFLRAPFDEGKAEERIRTLEKAVVEEGQSAEGKGNRKEMNLCDFGLCPLPSLLPPRVGTRQHGTGDWLAFLAHRPGLKPTVYP